MLSSASPARLENYCTLLHKNPLLIKWFVQSVASGADPDRTISKSGQAFETALRYCFENLFSRLTDAEKEILHVLAITRRALTVTELMFLIQQIGKTDQFALEATLSTLHNSSMLKRTVPDLRGTDATSQITLTDVASEYIARFAPPERKFFEKVQLALKRLREMVEKSAVQQAIYKYDLYAVRANTRDERICTSYLKQALDLLRAGKLEDASDRVDKAKALLPVYSEAYRVGALIESQKGDLYKAAEQLDSAIEYDSKSAIAHYQKACFMLYDMEDSQQALNQLDKTLTLDPGDETLETLRALALTRLGRCKEAAEIYERMLINICTRPRKWRITTQDQAAECYRRWAEQDRIMNDGELLKKHLERGRHILEAAFGANDFDSRMGSLYTNIIEDGLAFAMSCRDEPYAIEMLQALSDAEHVATCTQFRMLSYEMFAKCFGEDSLPVSQAKRLDLRWAEPHALPGAAAAPIYGTIKSLPPSMPYGFIRDCEGQDWFFHKTSVIPSNAWSKLKEGLEVKLEGRVIPDGRRRADRVEVLHLG